jgi:hypothetical protein
MAKGKGQRLKGSRKQIQGLKAERLKQKANFNGKLTLSTVSTHHPHQLSLLIPMHFPTWLTGKPVNWSTFFFNPCITPSPYQLSLLTPMHLPTWLTGKPVNWSTFFFNPFINTINSVNPINLSLLTPKPPFNPLYSWSTHQLVN